MPSYCEQTTLWFSLLALESVGYYLVSVPRLGSGSIETMTSNNCIYLQNKITEHGYYLLCLPSNCMTNIRQRILLGFFSPTLLWINFPVFELHLNEVMFFKVSLPSKWLQFWSFFSMLLCISFLTLLDWFPFVYLCTCHHFFFIFLLVDTWAICSSGQSIVCHCNNVWRTCLEVELLNHLVGALLVTKLR